MNKKRQPSRTCVVCGRPCWSKTCRECFGKGKYRGKLSKLRRVLDRGSPVDRRIIELVGADVLTVGVVELKEIKTVDE